MHIIEPNFELSDQLAVIHVFSCILFLTRVAFVTACSGPVQQSQDQSPLLTLHVLQLDESGSST